MDDKEVLKPTIQPEVFRQIVDRFSARPIHQNFILSLSFAFGIAGLKLELPDPLETSNSLFLELFKRERVIAISDDCIKDSSPMYDADIGVTLSLRSEPQQVPLLLTVNVKFRKQNRGNNLGKVLVESSLPVLVNKNGSIEIDRR